MIKKIAVLGETSWRGVRNCAPAGVGYSRAGPVFSWKVNNNSKWISACVAISVLL